MNIASLVVAVRIIDPIAGNKVGLFLNQKLIMERNESDERAKEIMREVASNLEDFTGRPMTTAEVKQQGDQFSWDQIITKIRDIYAREVDGGESPLASLNGGESFSRAPDGAQIVYPRKSLDIGKEGEYHVSLTHEGIIVDLWTGDEGKSLDHHAGTVAYEIGDLIPLVTH